MLIVPPMLSVLLTERKGKMPEQIERDRRNIRSLLPAASHP
jgi:hypothetical protein